VNAFMAPYFWRDCAGIIGYDFISRFVSEIDFDRQTLTLHDPRGYRYAGSGARIPLELAGTMPVIPMKLDGQYEGRFRVDVGSGSTVDLHTPFVEEHDLLSRCARGVETAGGGFGGSFRNRLVRMERIELGPYSWEKPIVGLSTAEKGALASEDYAGNVGTQILDRFKCIFDYERRELILEPGARFAKADTFSQAGVQLGRFGDTVRVMYVVEGSPAEKAGLQRDDAVVAVDGRPVLDHTPDGLQELLDRGAAGRKVRFEIVRDGKRQKRTVVLRAML